MKKINIRKISGKLNPEEEEDKFSKLISSIKK